MIQNIEITKLHPHYNNPRKDLGDLTELAESIKARGVLQNLTVIPWFSKITGAGADDPKQQEEMGYIVIIGHRRLAAAKLAGLTEVPCVITNMTPQEQMATMLLENIQRNDLTVYEQAQGFQMMLDLGETALSISKKTGFSNSTIRHRLRLLDLDSEKFRKSVERGATLMDYVELEKINDIEIRNSVLDKIGTSNFQWELQRAIEKEKSKAKIKLFIAELEKFAKQIEDTSGLQYVATYYTSSQEVVNVPDDVDTVEYFFHVSEYGSIAVYKKPDIEKQTFDNSEWEEKRKRNQEKRDALDTISNQAFRLRYDFVKNTSCTTAKKHIAAIIEFLSTVIIDDCYSEYLDPEDYADFWDIELASEEGEEDSDEDIYEINNNIIREYIKKQPELHLLTMAYLLLDDVNAKYYNWNNQYSDNTELDRVYELLENLGYEKSDEEKSLSDGTHELFQN